MSEKILVTGATGSTGREVIKNLSLSGSQIRAFVRDPEKANDLKAQNVEIVQGDLEQPPSIAAAMEDVSRLFLVSSFNPNQVELQSHAVQAAKQAGLKHIVKLSALGASLDSVIAVTRWHARTEQEIEDTGIAFTHLRPHVFMQNFFMFAPSIKENNVFYAPMKEARVSMVDVRDIAAVAAAVLTGEGHEGKTYNITGPEAVSYLEAAESLSHVLGWTVKYVDISLEEYQAGMASTGLPGWMIDNLVGLAGFFRSGEAGFLTPVVKDLTGTPGITFAQFAQDNADVFR